MFFSRFLAAIAGLSAIAIANPIHAGDAQLTKRQGGGTITGVLGPWIASEIDKAWSGPSPACGVAYNDGRNYFAATWKVEETGQYVQVCWRNDTGLVVWDEPTVNAANCLTHLHYAQANTCISVKGAPCVSGYIESGGRLQNFQTLIIADGNSESARLTSDESRTIQAGIRALQGYSVSGTEDNGPFFYVVTSETGDKTTSYAAQLNARWIGENEC
ncbi:hypothetical protein NM208_g11997 [Fusarium decemcellulare]|uniref:Uncharacterized protein n=1 Tax=Fusarium decemcellulare TaxID=57161 RepID=A0ACC1RRS8_9HYPO|nr:hypothetical protein NM208_g11997 [Fusarium decemcellulare]